MKTLKKIVSVMLVSVMLLGVMPAVSFSADSYYDSILSGEVLDVSYTNESVLYEFTPEISGYYKFYSIGEEDTCVICYDSQLDIIGEDDDSGNVYNFLYTGNFEAGNTYYFEVFAYAEDVEFQIALVKIDTDSFTKMAENKSYEVDINESNTSEYFSFTPQESDYYAFYSVGEVDAYGKVWDSQWYLVNENDDNGSETNFWVNCYLEEGETYYFEATAYDVFEGGAYEVAVKPTEVLIDIEIVKFPDRMVYYEGYVSDMLDYSGMELKLIYTDGSTIDWKYDDYQEIEGTYLDIYFETDELSNSVVCIQSDFCSNSFYLDVVEFPIESISVESLPSDIVLIENVDGYYDYDGKFVYEYEIPYDTKIKVEYKDGSSKIVNYSDGVDGLYFYDVSYQGYPDYWTLGEHEVEIHLGHIYTTIPVTVVDDNTPVAELGDVDGDGDISIMDATAIQLHIAKVSELKDDELSRADTDKDGEISILDATAIQLYIAKLITEF